MIKKTACILAALTLAGCAVDRRGPDWANDCVRNSSENPNAYNECEANKAANAALRAKNCAPCDTARPGVTLTPGANLEETDPGAAGKNTSESPAHVE